MADIVKGSGSGLMPGAASTEDDATSFGDLLDAWNVVYFGKRRLPGKAEVTGDGVGHDLDTKKSPGHSGTTITDVGRTAAKVTIKLTLWTDAQWKEASNLRQYLQPLSKDSKLQAVDVRHPGLNWAGVASLYIQRVGFPHPGSQPGTIELELSCLEYRKSAVSPVNTVLGSKTIGTAHDPNANNQSVAGPNGEASQRRVEASRPSATDAGPKPVNYTPADARYTPGV